jgi:DNA-binding LytR/AlgR family response regulator
MRVRIEKIEKDQPEEVVVYCRNVTPEVETLARQLAQMTNSRSQPSFFKGDEQVYLTFREILFFETDAEKIYAHTTAAAYETPMRLYELEKSLPGYFARVSRSAIVNTLQIFSIKKGLTGVNQITFRNSPKVLYGSRMYGQLLFQKMETRSFYENT